MHIPFVYMVKFKFLAHLPVAHLADPIVFSLILHLCQFAAFAYYVIDGFVSIPTRRSFAILWRLIYYRFDITGSYGVVLCCYSDRLCFSPKVSHY